MNERTRAIEKCFGIGLCDVSEEKYFAWQGCDRCNDMNGKILGNDVYDVKCYVSLENDNYYEFRLCGDCVYELTYGE